MSRASLAVLLLVLALGCAWWLRGDAREPAVRSSEVVPEPVEPAVPAIPPFTTPVATPEAQRETPSTLPMDPAETVVVRVRTSESLAGNAKMVGGIAFEVLAQRETPSGDFFAPLALAAGAVPLARGRTDELGEALLALPRAGLLFADNGLPRVYGRVVEPGYQARTVNGFHPVGAEVCTLHLMARRGATVRGRVVDGEGRPVAGEVRLREWIAPRGERQLGMGLRARALAEGAFELDYDEPVADGVLVADANVAGTGTLAGVELTLEAPPQDLVVVVTGPGVLRGRVLDGSGAPAAGLELFLGLAALDDAVGSTILPEPERSLREVQGGGHLWRMVQTGTDGAFEVRGLRSEPYVVRAQTQTTSGYPHLLTPVPVRPDGDEVVLRLSRPHVVVRLFDAEGKPWSGAAPGFARRTLLTTLPAAWPAEPCVALYPCASDGSSVGGEALAGKRSGSAEVVFEVPSGAYYVVTVLGGGFDGTPLVVEVPEGSNAVPVEFRARELGEFGTLAVRVFAAGDELQSARGLELVVESRGNAVPLLEYEPWRDAYPFSFRLPPGAYRVVAAGKGETDPQHGILWRPRTFGRAESVVEVKAGATHEHTLTLDAGARIEVTLAGKADEADVAATRKRYESLADPERAAELVTMAAHAELCLEYQGRRSEPVLFTVVLGATSAAGTHLEDSWPLGPTKISEVLPTGRWTLVARMPGGRESRVEVDLVEGGTTKVSLEF